MNSPNADFYYPDGRIDPDKAFNFVRERTLTMTSEEFVRLMSKELEVQLETSDVPTPDQPALRDAKADSEPDNIQHIRSYSRCQCAASSGEEEADHVADSNEHEAHKRI